MIKLENVNKSFGDLHVLKDVNLEVEEGEKLVIAGIFDNRDICIDSGKFGADTSADILCGVVRSVFD